MSKSSLYSELVNFAKEAIAPSACAGCGEWGTWLCPVCAGDLVYVKAQNCFRCKRIMPQGRTCPRCRRHTDLDGLVVALHYSEGPTRELVHQTKYDRIYELAGVLGSLAASAWEEHGIKCDAVTAVPLHISKARDRGFNQAELIAVQVARQVGLPFHRALSRVRATTRQAGLSRTERQTNVYRAFRVVESVWQQSFVVVDDVSATGATLEEVARALKDAGAKRVWGLVVARN